MSVSRNVSRTLSDGDEDRVSGRVPVAVVISLVGSMRSNASIVLRRRGGAHRAPRS
jgi:hypothetical protein